MLVTALALATGAAGCGGSGKAIPVRASTTPAVRDTARAPTLAEVRHDLARLPAWQAQIMIKQWQLMRDRERGGCPTDAELHTLTLRLDALAAGRARSSVLVLGCRAARPSR